MSIKLVLIEEVENLGLTGDVITVKDGYARNLLLPAKKAVKYNEAVHQQALKKRKLIDEKIAKDIALAKEAFDIIDGRTVVVGAKVDKNSNLFASVKETQISQSIEKDYKVEVSSKNIQLASKIKKLGVYSAKVTLNKEVIANIRVDVVEE